MMHDSAPDWSSPRGYVQSLVVGRRLVVRNMLYRVRDSAPDGSSPRGYVQSFAIGRRLVS